MLNYISAELYKLRHKKGLYLGTALLLGPELVMLLATLQSDVDLDVAYLFLVVLLPIGFCVAPILAVLTFDDQYGHGTLKNEVITGTPRWRIYLGKLAAAALMGTVLAAVAVGGYLLVCGLTCVPSPQSGEVLSATVYAAVCVYPLWMASLAFTFLLLFTIKSAAMSIAIVFLTTMFGAPLALMEVPGMPLLPRIFTRIFFVAPYRAIVGATGGEMRFLTENTWLYCWLVGLGWVVVTAALGMLILRRREIR